MAAEQAAGRLSLAANLDLTAAAPLRNELLALRGAPLEIDGAGVERLGGLCLQVLLAGQAAWASDGLGFHIAAPSPALTDALAALGAGALADITPEISE